MSYCHGLGGNQVSFILFIYFNIESLNEKKTKIKNEVNHILFI